jgi:hypothetical protein
MTKIVYNACYGGFGLSKAAILRYAELSGFTLERATMTLGEDSDDEFFTHWKRDCEYWSDHDISRTDPNLVKVVEELGDKASDRFSNLQIRELAPGTKYRIDEYDGMESVMTVDDYDWSIA